MCENCGCSDRLAHGHDAMHQHGPGVASVLSINDRIAERNRGFFLAKRVSVVNLLSFSRSHVDALVERTVAEYGARGRRVRAVTVADLGKMGVFHDHDHGDVGHDGGVLADGPATVDAHAVSHALARLELDNWDLVLLENGGNAAAQAVYDLGETARVAVFSVCEGERKPLKFPLFFAHVRAVVINEMNQADKSGFDVQAARSNLKQVAPAAVVLELAPETGAGMDAWYGFLEEVIRSNGK